MNVTSVAFRAFDPGSDPQRLLTLRREVEAADRDGVEITLAGLQAQMAVPGHDPIRDRLVGVDPTLPDRVIAYYALWPGDLEADFQIVVHPAHRRRGTATQLLQRMLELGKQLGIERYNGYAQYRNVGGNGFLKKHGFALQGAYTELHAQDLASVCPAELPAGFALKTCVELGQPGIMAEAMNEAYRGLWGHHEGSPEQVSAWVSVYPEDQRFLLLDADGRLAGVCCTRMDADRSAQSGVPTAYIDAPGLLAAHRGADLYGAFLSEVVRALYSAGARAADMESWGDAPAVLAAFEKLGFRILRQSIAYGLEG